MAGDRRVARLGEKEELLAPDLVEDNRLDFVDGEVTDVALNRVIREDALLCVGRKHPAPLDARGLRAHAELGVKIPLDVAEVVEDLNLETVGLVAEAYEFREARETRDDRLARDGEEVDADALDFADDERTLALEDVLDGVVVRLLLKDAVEKGLRVESRDRLRGEPRTGHGRNRRAARRRLLEAELRGIGLGFFGRHLADLVNHVDEILRGLDRDEAHVRLDKRDARRKVGQPAAKERCERVRARLGRRGLLHLLLERHSAGGNGAREGARGREAGRTGGPQRERVRGAFVANTPSARTILLSPTPRLHRGLSKKRTWRGCCVKRCKSE